MSYPTEGGPAQPVYIVNPAAPASGGGGPVEIAGQPIATTGQATIVNTDPIPVSGAAGAALAADATAQAIVDAILARLPASIGGRLPVGVQFPATQAISAADLPLPNDAATQTTLAQVLAALGQPLAVTGGLTDAQLRATPILVIDPIAYFASAAGGRVAYNITTGVVTINASGEQPLAALVNPTGSGKDLVLDLGEFGSSAATTFRRYRNATITPTGAPLTGSNIGGGGTTTVARMYIGGSAPTFTRSGGTVSKDAFIQASSTYFTRLAGRSVIRPGQSVSWTIVGPQSGNFSASVYFEFYERNAEA